jgi:MFS family permease
MFKSGYNYMQKILKKGSSGVGPNQNRIFLLCFNIIFALAGLGIVAPILPQLQAWESVSITYMGFFVSSFALARVVADIPAGILIDRYDNRFLTAAGIAIIFIGSLLSALAPTFFYLILGRIIAGTGSAVAVISIQKELLLLAGPDKRSTVMSYYMIARRAGASVFPLIGGLLAVFFNWRAVFLFCAVLNFAGMAISLKLSYSMKDKNHVSTEKNLEEPKKKESEQKAGHKKIRPIVFFALYSLVFTLFFNRNGLEKTVLPLFGNIIGLDSLKIGFALSCSSLVSLFSIYLGGVFADRYGRKLVVQVGLFALVIANGIFIFVDSFVMYFIACVLLGLATFILSLPVVMAADMVHSSRVGRTLGGIRLFTDIGTVSGPILLAWTMDSFGFNTSIGLSVANLLICTVIVHFFLTETKPNIMNLK